MCQHTHPQEAGTALKSWQSVPKMEIKALALCELSYQAQQGGCAFPPNQGLFWTHKYRRYNGRSHQSTLLFGQESPMSTKTRWRELDKDGLFPKCQSLCLPSTHAHYNRKKGDYRDTTFTEGSNLTLPVKGKWTSVPPAKGP